MMVVEKKLVLMKLLLTTMECFPRPSPLISLKNKILIYFYFSLKTNDERMKYSDMRQLR